MSNRKRFKGGIFVLVIVFIVLSIYQIYYVAHLSDALNLDYGAKVTFEDIKERLDNEMDQLWLIDIAQVVFASLVLLALYMRVRFLELEVNLFRAFKTSREEVKETMSVEIKEVKCRIQNIEEHQQILITLKSDFTALLNHIAMASEATSALVYKLEDDVLSPVGSFATVKKFSFYSNYRVGVGVVGEVAKSNYPIIINDVVTTELAISSGLGDGLPKQLIVLPLLFDNELIGVVELAYLDQLSEGEQDKLRQLCDIN